MNKKNKTQLCTAYKRFISGLGIHTGSHRLRVKGWKRYSMQVETKGMRGNYTYITQNSL